MRIAVISDTHLPRFRARLDAALERLRAERPDVILHCGDLTTIDGTRAFEEIAPIDAVAGNNDGPEIVARYGRRKIVAHGGVRIGMIHGDGVRGTTLERARDAFAPGDVDAIAFGHSHVPHVERSAGVWIVNPGSLTDKRRQALYSFAILDVERGELREPSIVRFS